LVAESPRRISLAHAARLVDGVPVETILLTADVSVAAVEAAVAATGAGGVQPYGADAEAVARWAQRAGLLVLRAVNVGEDGATNAGTVPEGQIPLLDSATRSCRGGTGRRLDWETLTRPARPFVLAGGLNPSNVAEAIALTKPWGVDASSGLESSPGIKDHARVAAFVEEAKRT
jgi:phosphoribosylanthranilate isomerase